MPEGIEVEIQKEGLEALIGDTIEDVIFYDKGEKIVRPIPIDDFSYRVMGKKIEKVKRFGKYIAIDLGDQFLTTHLAMTGRWLIDVPENEVGHTRILFLMKSGREVRYSDVRVFGRIRLEYILTNKIYHKGLDVLTADKDEIKGTLELLRSQKRYRETNIKKHLLNQNVFSGLGNVYANEVLYNAKLAPWRKVESLTDLEIETLACAIKSILKLGYEKGGLSFSDYYHVDGKRGTMQEYLNIYKKTRCIKGHEVSRSDEFDNRTSFYCPTCQR